MCSPVLLSLERPSEKRVWRSSEKEFKGEAFVAQSFDIYPRGNYTHWSSQHTQEFKLKVILEYASVFSR